MDHNIMEPRLVNDQQVERLPFAGMELLIRATADSTGGAYSMIEEVNPVDAPRHVHRFEDELFYVIEGEHVITVGDERYEVGPGDVVFGPRGVPHSQHHVVERIGRTLLVLSPGGFEGFFRDLSAADRRGASPEEVAQVLDRWGVSWV